MIDGVTVTWTTDGSAGAWLAERLHGFAVDAGSVVPDGFDAYARVFHPLGDGQDRRWHERAARNGRIAHPEMQLHLISRPPGAVSPGYEPLAGVRVGSLPQPELEALVALLLPHTGTPGRAWFAVWEGYAQLRPGASPPVIDLPQRRYALATGAVGDAVAVSDALLDQSPNLWWPDDRAWCVATEIDLAWTYVGGTEAAVAAVLASPVLEAMSARTSDRATADGDTVNAALDGNGDG
jgi:hypothetical protein